MTNQNANCAISWIIFMEKQKKNHSFQAIFRGSRELNILYQSWAMRRIFNSQTE
jgi:hypothetical protein